jgi:hypothetical protein
MATLHFNLDDSVASLKRAIQVVEPEVATETLELIDLKACRYLGPLAATYIASVWLSARSKPQVMLPTEPPALAAFCRFSGLAQLIARGEAPDPSNAKSETIPISTTSDAWNAYVPIGKLVHRHVGILDADFEESLRLCVHEVFQNISDHSKSGIGGKFCARYMNQKRHVRVAIADRGLGIQATLHTRYPEITDAQTALRRVIAGNYSAQSHTRNLGQGLSNLARTVENCGGQLVIFTQDACARLDRRRNWSFEGLGAKIVGTIVYFELPVDEAPDSPNN